jgi:hypothetical protein
LKVALPGAAAEGAGGITAALAGVTIPAWLGYLVAAGSVAAVGVGIQQDHDRGLSPEVTSRYPYLRNPREAPTTSSPYAGGGGPGAQQDRRGRGDPGYGASVDPNWSPVLDVAGPKPGTYRTRDGRELPIPGQAAPPLPETPNVSSYMPPVVTEVPKGSSSTPNLPYNGTANPYGYTGGGSGIDAAILANVPAGKYDASGDLSKGLGDCSSAVEDLVNILDGQSTAGRSMSTGNEAQWLSAHGFVQGQGGPGDFRVGFNSSHTQATLPDGTPFNWGSDAAAARGGVGGTGADDPAFTSHFYRPVSGNPASAAYPGADSMGLTSADLTLRNAGQRVNDTQHTEEQAEARLNELKAKGTATDRQLEAAEYAVAKAKREHQDAIDGLTVAQDKYNKSAEKKGAGGSNSDAQSLGEGFLGGLGEMFGLDGSVFKDPSQFGLFKIFKGLMGLKFADSGQGGAGGGGGGTGSAPGGDGGGLGSILSIIPQAFGDLKVGSPKDAPGQFMPSNPGATGTGGIVLNPFAPPGAAGPGNQPQAPGGPNIDMSNSNFGYSPTAVQDQIQQSQIPAVRVGTLHGPAS